MDEWGKSVPLDIRNLMTELLSPGWGDEGENAVKGQRINDLRSVFDDIRKSLLARPDQLFRTFAVGDVVSNGRRSDNLPRVVLDGRKRQGDIDQSSVFTTTNGIVLFHTSAVR